MALSGIGIGHMVAASLSLLTGGIQLTRRKGDAFHRRLGYVYVATMTVNSVTALTIYRFTGGFNVFHVLALYSLFNVGMALRPMLAHPRPHQWLRIHYHWVAWSYVGLSAAAVTEFLVRVLFLPGWFSAGVGTPPVMLLGWLVIRRFAPSPRRPAPAPAV